MSNIIRGGGIGRYGGFIVLLLVCAGCKRNSESTPIEEAPKAGSLVFGFDGPTNSEGVPQPWTLNITSGSACVSAADNGKTICLKCDKSSYALDQRFSADPKLYQILSWTWKADLLPTNGDVRALNDQALQVLVAFGGRKSISYIWDTTAPVDFEKDDSIPLLFKIKAVVVASGESDLGVWKSVTRNIYEDYRRLYGKEPMPIEGIRIQQNCQHTGTKAAGCVRQIRLMKKD